MTARHWMQIAALSFALGLTGAAIAQNTEGTTSSEDRASISNSAMDAPSAGAIVTPEDKALGMGQDKKRRGLPGDADDDEMSVYPGLTGDEELNINPGQSNDEESSVNPESPTTDGSNVPGSPGAGSLRSE